MDGRTVSNRSSVLRQFVFFAKHGRGEYFDSYGLLLTFAGLKFYMDTYSCRIVFTTAKPYKLYFPAFADAIVCTLYYFVVAASLGMLLYPILRQTFLKTIVVFLVFFSQFITTLNNKKQKIQIQ